MALVSEAGNGRVRNTTKTTGAKSDDERVFGSSANDGDAPKERTRRGHWYVLHDRVTEFQFRPLRVLSLGACQGQRRGS